MESTSLFHQLRPSCVKVAKHPTVCNLEEVYATLMKLDGQCFTDRTLVDYVLFPLKLTLQKELTEGQKILCYKAVTLLFSKSKGDVITEDLIIWSFNVFSFIFVHIEKDTTVISEELKSCLVQMISTVSKVTNQDNFSVVFKDNYLPLIGHIISVLVNCIEKEKSREIQLNALDCLSSLCGYSGDYTEEIEKHASLQINDLQRSVFLSSFLPGLSMMFNRIFQSNQHQHHKVVISSLNVFTQIISVTLNDKHFVDMESKNSKSVAETDVNQIPCKDNETTPNKKSIQIQRDKVWVDKTTENMQVIFKNILPIIKIHENVKVRLRLVSCLGSVLSSSFVTLSRVIPDCLDCLVTLSCDDYEDVLVESEKVLCALNEKFQLKGFTELKGVLDERLYSEFLSLPRVMNTLNEDIKLAKVQTIKGYLQFYGDRFTTVLNSYVHLEKFLCSLLQEKRNSEDVHVKNQILQLDPVNIKMVQEKTHIGNNLRLEASLDKNKSNLEYKHFKLFTNMKILKVIKDIIALFTIHGNVELLLDFLMEKCQQNPAYKAQAILLMNEIVVNLQLRKDSDVSAVVEMLLNTYLEDNLWRLPVSNEHLHFKRYQNDEVQQKNKLLLEDEEREEEDTNDLSISVYSKVIPYEKLHNNIQIICLLLEGIAQFAKSLKTNFNLLLIDVLYPVLEKVGSTNAAINQAALSCLYDITRFCNYNDISELILLNSDYLLNSITLQFRHLVYGSAAPSVLCVILKFCDQELLPLISDVIFDVFKALDDYQDEVAVEMLTVLKCLAISVNKWYNNISSAKIDNPKNVNELKSKDVDKLSIFEDTVPVTDFFKAYCKLQKQACGDIEVEDDDDDDDDVDVNITDEIQDFEDHTPSETTDEKEEKIPLHFQVIVTSLEKCISYISSRDDQIKMKALDVVYHGVEALRTRENDLLPALHKLWPSLIQRLKDKEQTVVIRTLDAICMMVECSGDFLRKRMSTEFLSHAVDFLEKHNKSFTKDTSKYLQIHQVQERLLRYLGDIVPTLDVSLELFCKVSFACVKYFDCRLHQHIQESSMVTLKKFYIHKPDVIWMLLQTLYNTVDLTTPSQKRSNKILVHENAKQRNVFSDNVIAFIKKENIC